MINDPLMMTVLGIVMFTFGIAVGRRKGGTAEQYKVKLSKTHENHIPPQYYGYPKGNYTKVTQCNSCDLTALREDMHPINPCPRCGGTVTENKLAGKWSTIGGVKQWVYAEAQPTKVD